MWPLAPFMRHPIHKGDVDCIAGTWSRASCGDIQRIDSRHNLWGPSVQTVLRARANCQSNHLCPGTGCIRLMLVHWRRHFSLHRRHLPQESEAYQPHQGNLPLDLSCPCRWNMIFQFTGNYSSIKANTFHKCYEIHLQLFDITVYREKVMQRRTNSNKASPCIAALQR